MRAAIGYPWVTLPNVTPPPLRWSCRPAGVDLLPCLRLPPSPSEGLAAAGCGAIQESCHVMWRRGRAVVFRAA